MAWTSSCLAATYSEVELGELRAEIHRHVKPSLRCVRDGNVSMGSDTLPWDTVLGTMKRHVSLGVNLMEKHNGAEKKEEKG